MKKLTDQQVAKALGWKPYHPRHKHNEQYWGNGLYGDRSRENYGPPAFTTSLDAIVGEIEARGLDGYVLNRGVKTWQAFFHGKKIYDANTAPLALCAALLAFIKEKP
jgi:hypothetical protein